MSRKYPGFSTSELHPYETDNMKIALEIAQEGIVLLENDGSLPLDPAIPIALFGSGATQTIKGGTGSGDVNERSSISVFSGLELEGFKVENQYWLNQYETDFYEQRESWKNQVLKKANDNPGDLDTLIEAYLTTPFIRPTGAIPECNKENVNNTAIFVLSRQAGEGADRSSGKGDFLPSDEEVQFLKVLRSQYQKLILILNTGGPMDLTTIKSIGMNAILSMGQAGMCGGQAVAQILKGTISPSGKLASTWAYHYSDYPGADNFLQSDDQKEIYEEGIWVGYRYFDAWKIPVLYPFGHGLSYTSFNIAYLKAEVNCQKDSQPQLIFTFSVSNTGNFSGKETVQLYVFLPDSDLRKEPKRLCAYAKTSLLCPGESETLQLTVSAESLTSFSEKEHQYILDPGAYIFAVGDSSANLQPVFRLNLQDFVPLLTVRPCCTPIYNIKENIPDAIPEFEGTLPYANLCSSDFQQNKADYTCLDSIPEEVFSILDQLDDNQLGRLACGDPSQGQDSDETFGDSGKSIPGAAGETSSCALPLLNSLVLADGPAGLRLAPQYQVSADGIIHKPTFVETVERGIFSRHKDNPEEKTFYQYCTAFPVGTIVAQTWNRDLASLFGKAVAKEMIIFGVDLWLAPGMNIQRNPLCGRNFEYYSEDPLLSGLTAAAVVNGVQQFPNAVQQ